MASNDFNKPLSASLISSNGAQIALANGVVTLAESLTLENGIYMVVYSAQFDRNSTGIRVLGDNDTIPSGPRNGVVTQDPISSNAYTTMKMTKIVNSNNSTINLYCYQNSGAALNVWTKIEAIRLV